MTKLKAEAISKALKALGRPRTLTFQDIQTGTPVVVQCNLAILLVLVTALICLAMQLVSRTIPAVQPFLNVIYIVQWVLWPVCVAACGHITQWSRSLRMLATATILVALVCVLRLALL